MRKAILLVVSGVTVLLACDGPVSPEQPGRLSIRAVWHRAEPMEIDAGRAWIIGPAGDSSANRTAQLVETETAFVDTIGGLPDGSYTVALEGFANGRLEVFGQTGGVQVETGRNTVANVTVNSFETEVTSAEALADQMGFRVSFRPVAGAEHYRVEWSARADFVGAASTTVPATAGTTITVPITVAGDYYVRARAINTYGSAGVPTSGSAISIIAPVASVEIQPDLAWLMADEQRQLNALLRDQSNNLLTNRTVDWSSDDQNVATVDANGLVTAVGAGRATITATSEGIIGTSIVNVATPTEIELGDLVTAGIDLAGEHDYYTFTASENDVVTFTITGASNFAGNARPRIERFAPSGTPLGGGFLNANSLWQDTLPETGTYVIRVSASTATSVGTYTLGLEGMSPLTPGTPAIALGDLTTTTIDAAGEVDLFTFDGSDGDVVLLTLTEGSGFNAGSQSPRVNIFTPSGALLRNFFDANTTVQDTLPETGTYVVRVHASSLIHTGTYTVGLEGLSPLTAGATTLTLGDLVTATIDAAGEVDLFTFTGGVGDVVFLSLTEGTGFNSGGQTPRLRVYAPSGGLVGSHQDANSVRQDTLQESGTYVVRVQANTLIHTGTYHIGLEGLSPLSPGAPTLSLGDLITATIDASGETDFYTFTGSAGDVVFMTLTEGAGFNSGGQTPRLRVYAPSGGLVGSHQDANSTRQDTLPETGTYVVRLFANTLLHTGTYHVGLEGLSPLSPGAPTLSLGDLTTATIDASGETDFYTFTGSAGDVVFTTLTEGAGFNSGGQTPRLRVYAPSGVQVGSHQDANSVRQDTLQESGTYVVRVQANTLIHTGTYHIGLEGLSPLSPGAPPLSLGDLITATIDASGETDFYTFTGSAGDVVFLTLTEGAGFNNGGQTPRLRVYAPSGGLVGSHQDANTTRQDTLPETGTYVVRLHANTLLHTGTYHVGFEGLSPLSPGAPDLTLGDLTTATIDASGEMDFYTFNGSAGDVVFLTLTEGAGFNSGGQTPRFRVYAPSGGLVGSHQDANSTRQDTLPETGTYVVRLYANSLLHTGTYHIGLEGLSPVTSGSPALSCAVPVSGSIDASGETDLFTFTGNASDSVTVSATETGGFSGGAAPRITIYYSDGAQLGVFTATGQLGLRLMMSGTYVVRVQANTYISAGTYDLSLECP